MDNRKIKILYIMTHCTKSGPIQQMYNLIKNLDRDIFEPLLITIYDEDNSGLSLLDDYKRIVEHRLILLSKIDILFGQTKEIRKQIESFNPDVIHTFGVFPDYMIAKMKFKNHVLTSRNYVFDDYPDQYGYIFGTLLAFVHLYAIKHTEYSCCCSESLQKIYSHKLSINLPYIRNGVDISKFSVPSDEEKISIRRKYNLPLDKIIFVYGGVFNERKNQVFLLESVSNNNDLRKYVFLLLGDGDEFLKLKEKYGIYDNILMPGNTTDMEGYLKASDYYISTSKSEGLPNGVLEAMACGLPVLLSDISQHKEVLSTDTICGLLYKSGDKVSFETQLKSLIKMDKNIIRHRAVDCVSTHFSAQVMSKNYQHLYITISKRSQINE